VSEEKHFVTALARGLQILGCFSRERPALAMADIVKMTGLSQPTVWRLCFTLRQTGHLEQGSEGGFVRLGPASLLLGVAATSESVFTESLRGKLLALAQKYRASAGLALRDGTAMVIVERQVSQSQLVLNARVGARLPMMESAYGRAFIAAMPMASRTELIEQLASAGAPKAQLESVAAELSRNYARDGCLISIGDVHPEVNSVTVVIPADNGEPLFSLNLGAVSSDLPDEAIRTSAVEEVLALGQWITEARPLATARLMPDRIR